MVPVTSVIFRCNKKERVRGSANKREIWIMCFLTEIVTPAGNNETLSPLSWYWRVFFYFLSCQAYGGTSDWFGMKPGNIWAASCTRRVWFGGGRDEATVPNQQVSTSVTVLAWWWTLVLFHAFIWGRATLFSCKREVQQISSSSWRWLNCNSKWSTEARKSLEKLQMWDLWSWGSEWLGTL